MVEFEHFYFDMKVEYISIENTLDTIVEDGWRIVSMKHLSNDILSIVCERPAIVDKLQSEIRSLRSRLEVTIDKLIVAQDELKALKGEE